MGQRSPNAMRSSDRDLSDHLRIYQYGSFQLTAAVRPSVDLQVIPRQGYRCEEFRDDRTGCEIPMVLAAASQEILFDAFIALLDELGSTVDVIFESRHDERGARRSPREFLREHIDLPVLESYLYEFRDLILEDGCLGIAVIDPRGPTEIQFDDHKSLVVYSRDSQRFCEVLERFQIERDDSIKLISEGEHLHSTCLEFADQLLALCNCVGAESDVYTHEFD